ncbi:MAG: hypothetical protein K8S97_11340 [Anaerolineae bacterium]|nr:hypothetical protein [Anaerolineae bacterium]
MAWRLDLADQPLHAVHFLAGDPLLLAVWLSESEVRFYDVTHGVYHATAHLALPTLRDLTGETWREYIVTLCAPNGAYQPCVDTGSMVIMTSYDGRLRLCWERHVRLVLDMDGERAVLRAQRAVPFIAVALDRDLGTVAALDAAHTLYFFQQHVYVGHYALTDYEISDTPALFVPDVSGRAVIAHENGIVVINQAGQIQAALTTAAPIDQVACSPEGDFIVVADRDALTLHVYDAELHMLYQGSAHDVFDAVRALQLLPRDLSPASRIASLAVTGRGDLAFVLAGSVCCSTLDALPAVPRQGTLF